MAKADIKAVLIEKRSDLTQLVDHIRESYLVIAECHSVLEYVACKEQDRRIYMYMTLNLALESLSIDLEKLEKYCV